MALGPELLTDPGFDTGTDWTLGDGGSITGGQGVINTASAWVIPIRSATGSTGMVDETTYRITVDITEFSAGVLQTSIGGTSGDTAPDITGDGFYEFDLVRETGRPDYLGFSVTGAGCTCKINSASVKEVLPGTTVEIEWIDSISAAATGNKIYRDDVEIADIGMGVQTYNDTTAETGTEYKYEVQAHDGAGDETTQEVTGVNTQTITTAS